MFFDVFNVVKKCNEFESVFNMNSMEVDFGGIKMIYCRDLGNFIILDFDK